MSNSNPAPVAYNLLERLTALNTQVCNLASKVSLEAKSHLLEGSSHIFSQERTNIDFPTLEMLPRALETEEQK